MMLGTSCVPRFWNGVVDRLPSGERSSEFDSPLSKNNKNSSSILLSVTKASERGNKKKSSMTRCTPTTESWYTSRT